MLFLRLPYRRRRFCFLFLIKCVFEATMRLLTEILCLQACVGLLAHVGSCFLRRKWKTCGRQTSRGHKKSTSAMISIQHMAKKSLNRCSFTRPSIFLCRSCNFGVCIFLFLFIMLIHHIKGNGCRSFGCTDSSKFFPYAKKVLFHFPDLFSTV